MTAIRRSTPLVLTLLLAAVVVVVALILWPRLARPRTPPDIVLIVVDTLRADHLGCYGCDRNTTRNIDKFAREAILFRNAISPAPWTLPSVATILTSQYPCVLGVRDKLMKIDNRFPLLPELLKQHDYQTHGIISHVALSAHLGFGRGYDIYDEDCSLGHEGVSSPEITRKAISFLRKKHEKPFFLFVHYFDPHYNYILHRRYNYYPSYIGRVKSGQPIYELWHMRFGLSRDDINYLVSLYDSEIAFTDEHIGKLLDELKKQGLYDNSIIIITADHGEEFMERGWIGHTITVHQELILVPLIMKFPGRRARVIDSPVGLIDITPTIYNYLRLTAPDDLDGKALDLNPKPGAESRPIFSETFNPQIYQPGVVKPIAFRSAISDDWKLILDQENGSKQLYDLSHDPYERNNLSGQCGEQEKALETILKEWIEHVSRKEVFGAERDADHLLTPEQRRKLKSLGYL